MFPDNQLLDNVLGQSPESILTWVQHHHAAIDCSRSWQHLAYSCSSDAAIDPALSDHERVALATAAVLVYDRLGEACTSPGDRSYYTMEGMSIRAFLVNKLGPQPGHPLLDLAILEDWFFRRLRVSYENAVCMNTNALSLSTEDYLRISSLKDRIRLMKSVRPQKALGRIDELNRWYMLLDTSRG